MQWPTDPFVTSAMPAEAALRSATLRKVDLMVIDLGLGDLDGAVVVERVRSWSTVPIIVLSVRSSEEEKVRLLELCAGNRAAPAANPSSKSVP